MLLLFNRYMEIFFVLVAVLAVAFLARGEVREVIACSRTPTLECGHFELTCAGGSRIHHLNQEYVYKGGVCSISARRDRCHKEGGCCVYESTDCSQSYTYLHVYNLMRECSRKNVCGPLPAPSNVLSQCENNESTYVRIQYECIEDETFLNICEQKEFNGSEVNIVFDQAVNTLTQPVSCICETSVVDGDAIEINYKDLRMIRAHSETGSICSSAILRGEPDSSGARLQCNESIPKEDNLKANIRVLVSVNESSSQLRFILENLFADGTGDSPVMVWLSLKAVSGTLRTRCFPQSLTVSTRAVTTQTVLTKDTITTVQQITNGLNNTGDIPKPVPEQDNDNTAVIVGVLIPVIIVVITAVILFILWKRKHRPMKRIPAAQNSYTDSGGSRSSTAVPSTEYDEIRDAPNVLRPPLYDPVYELAKEPPHSYVNVRPNGTPVGETAKKKHHTYQNIKKQGLRSGSRKPNNLNNVSTKLPFGDFINKKSQLFSFFRRRNDNLPSPSIIKKPSDASMTSYDHLDTGNPEVILQVKPPPDDTRNPYSSTNANDAYSHIKTDDPNIHTDTNVTTTEMKELPNVIKRSASPKGVKAVEVGDSYIEFQFGTLDDNDLNLLQPKSKTCENVKLKKPNRPPPKPSPKLDKAEEVLMDSSLSVPTEKPNKIDDQQAYDYAVADENEQTAGSLMFKHLSKTDKTDNSDSKDGAIVYSYADIDENGDQNTKSLIAELVYEEIDHNADPGLRKCKSSQDILCDSSGYEVPVKGIGARPVSAPHVVSTRDKLKTKSAIKGIESIVNEVASPVGLGNVVKELKEIENLPDLSDPEALPKELKYANLGLHTPKPKETAKTNGSKAITKASDTEVKATEENSVEQTGFRKGVLSLAKKFEASC